MAPHQVPEYSLGEDRGLSIAVEVMDELADASISSPSHKCRVEKDVMTTRVTLMNETVAMDRDFILNIEAQAGASSSARVVSDRDGWLVHTSFCPRIENGATPCSSHSEANSRRRAGTLTGSPTRGRWPP